MLNPTYQWQVTMTMVGSLAAAVAIGANDIANVWGTSVGSKAVTITTAVMLGVFFELLGAITASVEVQETFRKGIADPDCYETENDAGIMVTGNLWSAWTLWGWLSLATLLEMAVSTTHSSVGSLVGSTIASKGTKCVIWNKKQGAKKLWIPGGIAGIVISWLISPFLSMALGAVVFWLERTFILRAKHSFSRVIYGFPIMVFFTVWIGVFLMLAKGMAKRICDDKKEDSMLCYEGKVRGDTATWISFVVAVAVTLALYPIYTRVGQWAKDHTKRVRADDERELQELAEEGGGSSTTTTLVTSTGDGELQRTKSYREVVGATESSSTDEPEQLGRMARLGRWLNSGVNVNIHRVKHTNATVNGIHTRAEKFDDDTENVFRYLQVFSACTDAYSHGASDTINAMNFAISAYSVYQAGEVSKSSTIGDDVYWIMTLGGLCMGVGMYLFGYVIMRVMGVKLIKVTPSRGFAIEFSSAIVLISGAYAGYPLSSTHCNVGAAVGVGLLEGRVDAINLRMLGIILAGWIITLAFTGFFSGLWTAQAVYSPAVQYLNYCNGTVGG